MFIYLLFFQLYLFIYFLREKNIWGIAVFIIIPFANLMWQFIISKMINLFVPMRRVRVKMQQT